MRSKNEQTLNNILKLINDCYFESGVYPTFQQIATAVGLSVPQTYRYVDELIKRGEIEKSGRYGDLQTKEIVNAIYNHITATRDFQESMTKISRQTEGEPRPKTTSKEGT